MSFSLKVKNELTELKIKKYCCHSSFLLGLLSDCKIEDEKKAVYTTLSAENAELVERLLINTWKVYPQKIESSRMGAPLYTLEFDIPERGKELFSLVDEGTIDFSNGKCASCEINFMRGVFVSNATISDPMTGYHLEFKFKNAKAARLVFERLADMGIEPKIINRKGSVGLYYKNSGMIEDLLGTLGAVKTYFDFIDCKSKREVRNGINRRINCEAQNISKSVDAAQKQIAAISKIESAGKLAMLPDELFDTAKLRLENHSVSLSELARLHNPPISKSGLTHRLAKIMEYAEEIKSTGGKE